MLNFGDVILKAILMLGIGVFAGAAAVQLAAASYEWAAFNAEMAILGTMVAAIPESHAIVAKKRVMSR
jgi:hypothetical protein